MIYSHFNKTLINFLKLIAGLCFFWFALRFYFFISFGSFFDEVSTKHLLYAFVSGLRYDLSMIFYTNAFFFWLLYFPRISGSTIYKVLFVALNSIFGVLHLMDMEYFSLVGRRIDRSFLSVVGETKMTSYSSFFTEYGYVLLFLIAFLVYFSFLIKSLKASEAKPTTFKFLGYFWVVVIVGGICIRGGFQRKPLAIVHAYEFVEGDGVAANLSLNTVYDLIRSKGKSPFPDRFRNKDGPFVTDHKYSATPVNLVKKPKNILFVFIESMSTYALDKVENSYIKSINQNFPEESFYIDSHFGNGRFSMDALTSVFLGVPSFFEIFIFKSNFAQNRWVGLGEILKENGFDTFFIHAAEPGTMYFDKIAPAVGITDFYSLSGDDKDIPSEMMAPWGVHDEYMYKKAPPIIKNYEKKPFMGVLFSVSSHIPYVNPPGYDGSRKSSENNYFRTIKYADNALSNFMEKAKKEPWFEDTLFIITGDHSPPLDSKWLHTPKEKSRLPMVFYFPGSNIGKLKHREMSQHLDLSLSLFDLLEIEPKDWSPYGRSIFDSKARNLIGYYWDQSMHFVEKNCLSIVSVLSDASRIKKRSPEADCPSKPDDKQNEEYSNFIKSYVNRLEKNQIYN